MMWNSGSILWFDGYDVEPGQADTHHEQETSVTTNGTQAIDRAAELLSLVVLADEPLAFTDLVADTGLAKSTASRLLQALERHRLLHREDSGGYTAGPLFALYAARNEPLEELVRIAQPTLQQIGEATGETVNLAVVRGNTVVQVAQIDSTFVLGATNWVDVEVPPHASALGKVFYAAGMLDLPDEPMQRLTPRTIADREAFDRHLAEVRAQGYAVTSGELEVGLDGIAVPVRNRSDEVIAAIGISGPSDRIAHVLPALGSLLKRHANDLSRALGHHSRKEGAA
jgi:IclR family transcriptional regulator, acetate operon repressor